MFNSYYITSPQPKEFRAVCELCHWASPYSEIRESASRAGSAHVRNEHNTQVKRV